LKILCYPKKVANFQLPSKRQQCRSFSYRGKVLAEMESGTWSSAVCLCLFSNPG